MRLLKTLLIVALLLPLTVSANFAATWFATSTSQNWILPNLINGLNPAIVVDHILSTSTTATSTFANGIDLSKGCFAVNGTCISGSGGGGAGTVTSVNASGGSTGFTFSGGPITTSGTLTLAGLLVPTFGGTGSTTLFGLLKGNGTNAIQTAVPGVDYAIPGNYMTALTGDGTATGPGSVPFTLATVNSNVGSFTNANITVNGKGLITAAANGTNGISALWPITFNTNVIAFDGLSTSTAPIIGGVPFFSGVNKFSSVATTSVTCAGTATCSTFTVIGTTPVTITGSSSATPAGSATQVQYNNFGTFGASTELTFSTSTNILTVGGTNAGKLQLDNGDTGSGLTIQGTGSPGSFVATFPSITGSVVLGTGSAGQLAYWNNANVLTNVATSSETCTAPLSCTTFTVVGTGGPITLGTVGIANGGTGATTFGQGWVYSVGGTTALSASTSPTVNYITATSTATSTFAGGLATNLLNVTSTTASSTFRNGINLTAGCFAINSLCIGGSSGSSGITAIGPLNQTQTGPTVTFATGTNTTNGLTSALTITGTGNTVTYTPSVSGTLTFAGGGTNTTGGFSANSFVMVNSAGNGLVASSSPTANFYTATSTTATSTFAGGFSAASIRDSGVLSALHLADGNGAIIPYLGTSCGIGNVFTSLTASGVAGCSGVLSVIGTLPVANGGTGSTTLSGILRGNGTSQVSTLAIGTGLSFDGTTLSATGGSGGTNSKWATSTDNTSIYPNTATKVGIGTTTPGFLLNLVGSGPQLALSDSNSLASGAWTMRNAGGNLYIGTTSPSTFATNTPSAIQINSIGNAALGVATATPWRVLSVTGTVGFDGLTGPTAGSITLCITQGTTKEVVQGNSATTCAPSSIKYKRDVETLDVGLDELMRLHPVTFYYKAGGDKQQNMGFIAEEADPVDMRLVEHNTDGTPKGLRLDNFISLLVKSVQDQQKEIETLKENTFNAAQEDWQWMVMGMLFFAVLLQQRQINKIKNK